MPTNDILLNKYRLDRKLGEGAAGEVYLAKHLGLDLPRALKILRRDTPGLGSTLYGELLLRFRLEARVGALIEHPNVVRVYDFERDGEDLILVMEYCPGGSLAEYLERARKEQQPIEVEECLRWGVEMAQGLAELHKLDAVHRDLKPTNVLFDAQGRAKIADMGLAQVPGGPSRRQELSEPQPHPGTPGYMSPEQKNESNYLTSASDVYALGLLLFEALTLRSYSNQKPGTRAKSLRADLPEWLDELLVRMLAKDPEVRPWDGAEAAEALREGERLAEQKRLERERLDREEREREREEHAKAARQAIIEEKWEEAQKVIAVLEQQGKEGQALAGTLGDELKKAQKAADDRDKKRLIEERKNKIQALKRQVDQEIAAENWMLAEAGIDKLEQEGEDGRALAGELRRLLGKAKIEAENKRVALEAAQAAQAEREREAAEQARADAARQRNALVLELAPGVGLELVRVPAGEFLMGSDKARDKVAYDDETPQHKLSLPEYLIGKAPVTVAQFAAFVKATGHKSKAQNDLAKKGDHPVTNVTWDDGVAFCQWASKQTGRSVRLPGEAEWEKAARGTDGRIYPWGDQAPDEKRCNFNMNVKDTTPVGKYSPQGDSPYGCVDMAGNVWGWTGSLYKPYPYNAKDGREDPKDRGSRVLRGGGFYDYLRIVRCGSRNYDYPGVTDVNLGFRVCVFPI